MNIGEFLKQASLTTEWLATKTGYTEVMVRAVVRGDRKPSPKAFARYQWAARGALDPAACGVNPEKAKAHLPDLAKLPHPYYPGVTWLTHCAPALDKKPVSKEGAANP